MRKKLYSLFSVIIISIGLFLLFTLIKGYPSNMSMTYYVARFVSYFTVISNIAVLTFFIFRTYGSNLLESPLARTIIEVNIVFTCLIYYTFLPAPVYVSLSDMISSHILHGLTPLLYVMYNIIAYKKEDVEYTFAIRGTVYVCIYVICAIFISNIVGEYPYPFLDIFNNSLRVTIEYGVLLIAFYNVIFFLTVKFKKMKMKKAKRNE